MRSRDDDADIDPFKERPSLIWRLITGVFKLAMILLLLLLVALGVVYYFSQQQPDFYATALDRKPEESKALGSRMEQTVFDIYNSAVIPTTWQGEIVEDEINGWLTSELPEKFHELLPEYIKDPRVKLTKNKLTIACRCTYKDLKGIVVGDFDLFCTDQPNQVAVRIRGLNVGIVPLPVTQFADQITESLQKSGYQSSWTKLEGDPVLLVNVPDDHLVIDDYYRIEVRSFDIEDKKILITGETVEWDDDKEADNGEPDEPVPASSLEPVG